MELSTQEVRGYNESSIRNISEILTAIYDGVVEPFKETKISKLEAELERLEQIPNEARTEGIIKKANGVRKRLYDQYFKICDILSREGEMEKYKQYQDRLRDLVRKPAF